MLVHYKRKSKILIFQIKTIIILKLEEMMNKRLAHFIRLILTERVAQNKKAS